VSRPLIIAHRGASGYEVENSLAAFRAAGDRGADAVELDIYSTADGALVVYHDETIGHHQIPHCSLREIHQHPLPNGEAIPTLEEALAAIVPGMVACVEIKSVGTRAEEHLLQVIEQTGAPDRVMLHSFDHRVIHRMGERRPQIKRGVMTASYPMHPVRCLEDAGAAILWQACQFVDEALVEMMHANGIALYAWTVNDPVEVRRFGSLGVDGICTDFPDVALAALASLPA